MSGSVLVLSRNFLSLSAWGPFPMSPNFIDLNLPGTAKDRVP